MPNKSTLYFPPQKLSIGRKTEKWGKQCIEAGEDLAIFRYNGVRESYKNKLINYNLANDILDTTDLERVCNPMGIKQATFPATMQNYPIANPKIDLLVGEERKRRFDWHARVVNDDAIGDKEEAKKEEIKKFVENKIQQLQQEDLVKIEQIQDPQQKQAAQQESQQKIQVEMQDLGKYLKYEFQDMRERMATHTLNYLYKTLDLKEIFSRGFEDALIAGEEVYCTDIIAGEPTLRRVNPLNLHTVRSGESPYIDDADIIVEDGYFAPGMVIDDFYDVLTDAHIKEIDEGISTSNNDGFINIGEKEQSWVMEGLIDTDSPGHNNSYGQFWDTEGNIRVTRVLWRSQKKIGELIYYDQTTGEKLETIVPEDYKPKVDLGEEVKWIWINEWWEGTRIGEDIYVKIQPRPVQFRSMNNLSKCGSGYIGLAYNINSSKAKSLMDRMKPYQYLYNVFMYRTELAFAKAKGKIGSLDLAQVPDKWNVDQWMYYAEIHGWAVKDSFKEAKKGAAQGKLAGQMQNNSPVFDMDLGNYIQQHIMMLQYIETQLGKIAGVTEQRQGQIENRELVGNVERAVSQSSHITEKWFGIHDTVKKQAMAALLETAKYAYRNRSDKRIQYMLDDMSTNLMTLDGAQFNESDYGIVISDASSDQEMLATLKSLGQAGLQADKLNFSQLMDLYMNPSIASMRRNLEGYEQEKMQRDQQAQQQQQQQQQAMQQQQMQMAKDAQEFELTKMDKEHSQNMELEQLKGMFDIEKQSKDLDNDGMPDVVEVEKIESIERMKRQELALKAEIEREKLNIERQKLGIENNSKERDRQEARNLKDKELRSKAKELKSKERTEKLKIRAKPKVASK
jgi:hypothetical protein